MSNYSLGDNGTYKEEVDGVDVKYLATVIKIVEETGGDRYFISVDALGKVVEATDDNFSTT